MWIIRFDPRLPCSSGCRCETGSRPVLSSPVSEPLLSGWRYRAVVYSVVLSALGYLGVSLWGGWRDVSAAVAQVGIIGILIALSLSLVNYGLRFSALAGLSRAMGSCCALAPEPADLPGGLRPTTTPGKAGETPARRAPETLGGALSAEFRGLLQRASVGSARGGVAHTVRVDALSRRLADHWSRCDWRGGGIADLVASDPASSTGGTNDWRFKTQHLTASCPAESCIRRAAVFDLDCWRARRW